ncbi:hypothetical protein Q8W71_19860 [Methylobacterium sp. NEAU 140]|nr:hypothetical protein [Methylobacterium sp. NEAU 140]MDP4024890.1 hypothetical protein [Methylobacterium sp. NEAU 140]
MTPAASETGAAPSDGRHTFPPHVVAALDEHCRVEKLSREAAICALVTESLRFKGYLPRRPADAGP